MLLDLKNYCWKDIKLISSEKLNECSIILNLAAALYEHVIKSLETEDSHKIEITDNKLVLIREDGRKIDTNINITSDIYNSFSKMIYIFIQLENEIIIIEKKEYKQIDVIKTFKASSSNDIISLSILNDQLIVGFLHPDKGCLGINYYDENHKKINEKKIHCHKSEILKFTINNNGTYASTISNDGMFIKILDLTNLKLHTKFARGKLRKSTIYSLSFNTTSTLIATTSSSGYLKIFNTDIMKDNAPKNKIDWLMSLISLSKSKKRIFKIFVSKAETNCKFESEDMVSIYSKDGYVVLATIDLNTGKCDVKNTKIDMN